MQWPPGADGAVIDQYVDRFAAREQRRDRRFDRRHIRQLESDGGGFTAIGDNLGRGLIQPGLIARRQYKPRAGRRHGQGNRPAQPARATGDKRRPPRQGKQLWQDVSFVILARHAAAAAGSGRAKRCRRPGSAPVALPLR